MSFAVRLMPYETTGKICVPGVHILWEGRAMRVNMQSHLEDCNFATLLATMIYSLSNWPICNNQTSNYLFGVSRKNIIATKLLKCILFSWQYCYRFP